MISVEQRELIEEGPPYETFKNAFEKAHELNPRGGTCLEFGVGKGRTYAWQMARIIESYHSSSLIGYDSFQGLPKEIQGVWYPERHSEGCLQWSKESVLQFLESRGLRDYFENDLRFRFVKGWFKDSLVALEQYKRRNVIFINMDVDIYRSTISVLDFIRPFLKKNVVVYWDDWKDPNDVAIVPEKKWGEHLAWEHWSIRHPEIQFEELEVNKFNQRSWIIK